MLKLKARGRETWGNHLGDTALQASPRHLSGTSLFISPVTRAAQGTESHAFQELYWLPKSSGTAEPQRHIQEKVDRNHQTTHYPVNQRQT